MQAWLGPGKEALAREAAERCSEAANRRRFCWSQAHEGKETEECLVEELEEKRCKAFTLCPPEALAFYATAAGSGKGPCSLWAESFAYAPRGDTHGAPQSQWREAHEEGRDRVEGDRGKLRLCREASHALTKCLSKFSAFAEDEGDLGANQKSAGAS